MNEPQARAILKMSATPEWREFEELLKEQIEVQRDTLESCKPDRALFYQGAVYTFRRILEQPDKAEDFLSRIR